MFTVRYVPPLLYSPMMFITRLVESVCVRRAGATPDQGARQGEVLEPRDLAREGPVAPGYPATAAQRRGNEQGNHLMPYFRSLADFCVQILKTVYLSEEALTWLAEKAKQPHEEKVLSVSPSYVPRMLTFDVREEASCTTPAYGEAEGPRAQSEWVSQVCRLRLLFVDVR